MELCCYRRQQNPYTLCLLTLTALDSSYDTAPTQRGNSTNRTRPRLSRLAFSSVCQFDYFSPPLTLCTTLVVGLTNKTSNHAASTCFALGTFTNAPYWLQRPRLHPRALRRLASQIPWIIHNAAAYSAAPHTHARKWAYRALG